ncbi:MAG: hypothetical protein V4582_23035 [Pseudomonadota bacterium]
MKSFSVTINPLDSRCRHWAKIVRAGQALPHSVVVQGANDIPVPYANLGDEELMPGDVLFEGEANHHRRTDRGWTYFVRAVTNDGDFLSLRSGFSVQKAQLKEQGMSPALLMGSGDIAAMVRIAHGLRAGLQVSAPE